MLCWPWKLKLYLTCTFKISTVAPSFRPWGATCALLRIHSEHNRKLWLRNTPGDFLQRRAKWRRADRLTPFSEVFQLHLSKNKCTSWTIPRRPPGWAIGLAESLASTSCFTPPLGAGGQPHLSGSYLASKLTDSGTEERQRCCSYWTNLNIQTDKAAGRRSQTLAAEVSHAFN